MSDLINILIQKGDRWRCFRRPIKVISAWEINEVRPCLESIEHEVEEGHHAAGFIAYEAAGGIDGALVTKEPAPSSLPLLWFGIYRGYEEITEISAEGRWRTGEWKANIDAETYNRNIDRIREYIAAGDTYQVNYTHRLKTSFEGSPLAFWLDLIQRQQPRYGAYIETKDWAIASSSPELFVSWNGDRLISRPMKGTAKRGLTVEQDREQKEKLFQSEKDRAENAMIVDMIRNDLGRVARKRSVRVRSIFKVEKYPTVFQMTSTVCGRSDAAFPEIIAAMFPCASITGAPKVRTMQIIRELETEPRGVYTGCMGYVEPGRRGRFNVAIRTAVIDKVYGQAVYGVGGGIVWDSTAREEFAECRAKSLVLGAQWPEFELLETILWDGKEFFLLSGHLERLKASAEYFNYCINWKAIDQRLEELTTVMGEMRHRVRLCVNRRGAVRLEHFPLGEPRTKPWRMKLAKAPVNSQNLFLYHKTTYRVIYERAKGQVRDCDDVVLWNEKGQVTETTIGNLVVEIDDKKWTPPVSCGLLPGVFRTKLLNEREILERVITVEELGKAMRVFMINSVRGWVEGEMVFAE